MCLRDKTSLFHQVSNENIVFMNGEDLFFVLFYAKVVQI